MNAIRVSAASTLLILGTTAALRADVTAQEVWADWQSYLAGVGYTVTGEESTRLGQVTVTNLVMETSTAADNESSPFSVTMPRIVFTENGDGTVNVQIPERSTMAIEASDGAEEFDAEFTLGQSGMTMTVSGDADDMTYTYAADQMDFALSSLAINEEPISRENARGTVTVNSLSGVTRMQELDLRNYTQTFSAAGVAMDLFFVDQDNAD